MGFVMLELDQANALGALFARAGYSRVERPCGSFYRRFALPDSADAEGITANGKHGVLEIAIPKKAEQQPRRIQVQ